MESEVGRGCLICFDPSSTDSEMVFCQSNHPIHMDCLITMVWKMGRETCPYCQQSIPRVADIRKPCPSLKKQALIVLQNLLYLVLLTSLCVIGPLERRFWCLNYQLFMIRMRCDFAPVGNALDRLNGLRDVVLDSIRYVTSFIGLYPFASRTMTMNEPWPKREYISAALVFAVFVMKVANSHFDDEGFVVNHELEFSRPKAEISPRDVLAGHLPSRPGGISIGARPRSLCSEAVK